MEQAQLPTSLEEVESLIHQLYRPTIPGQVAKVQETLQKLQRSPEGWELAVNLLKNKDEQVRFFGALTFTVKLNTDSSSLSPEDAESILQTLVGFLVEFLANGEGALVIRKLCSTLVAFFLQFSTRWTECIKHLTYCLYMKQAIPYSKTDNSVKPDVMLQNMANSQVIAILWFSGGLVEEVGKMDSNSMKQHKFHQQVIPNVDYAVPIISKYITDPSADIKVRQECLRCFQSWQSYAHRAFVDDKVVLEPLQSLTKPTIMCIAEDDLYEIAVEIISEILGNYSRFLLKEDFDILFSLFNSPWAQERYERLIQGDYEFDSLQFGMLLVAFGDANTTDLTQNIGNGSQYEQFLPILCGLLGAEGYAVYEDKIFVPALEFWTTYVENVLDGSYEDENSKSTWLPVAQRFIFQAIERCVRKIQFPPANIFNSWDSVDRVGFKDARRDFSDLMQQFYVVTGIKIMDFFVGYAGQAMQAGDWAKLEVAWFVVLSLADCVAEDGGRDEYLKKILSASVLDLFVNPSTEIPTRAKRTFLDVIKAYSDFFIANTENLPAVLNIVFSATSNPALASLASHSISKLCSECRYVLLPHLGAFLQQYSSITAASSLDGVVKEGVIEGIAALIQAIPDDEAKIGPLNQLLDFVEADVQICLQLILEARSQAVPLQFPGTPSGSNFNPTPNANELVTAIGLVALKCLEGMAKGSQAQTDAPVDLENDEKETSISFWIEGNGAQIQQRIISIINRVFDVLGRQGEIVEATCQVLRKGFIEPDPGPFVLSPETAAELFLKTDTQTPRLGYVIRTASLLIQAQKRSVKTNAVLEVLLNWVSQILHNLGEPVNDPEISQDAIEFLTRLLPDNIHVFLSYQPPSALEYLFMFTLKALAGTDPLPKVSAAQFWSTILILPPSIHPSLQPFLTHLGPLLARALIYNISGHASRSELDKLSDPIKKLVIRHPQAKGWLEAALFGEEGSNGNVGEGEKRMWLQKIMNQRGSKLTNDIVKELWLACRGTNFAYAS